MTDSEPSTAEPGSPGDEPPPRSTTIDLVDPRGLLSSQELGWLLAQTEAATSHLQLVGDLRVRIVNDAEMDAAHRQFAGVPGTTDVLTFDLSTGPELDVDLFICADVAARQAESREHDRAAELLLYIVHGVLHCLGHDDHDEAEAARMHEREDEILTAIGVGRVFRSGGGA